MGLRGFFQLFFFLRKNFHGPGHMVKKHRSEIFLDRHIWDKITHSGVLRDNLVCLWHWGWQGKIPPCMDAAPALWPGSGALGEGGSLLLLFLLLHCARHCLLCVHVHSHSQAQGTPPAHPSTEQSRVCPGRTTRTGHKHTLTKPGQGKGLRKGCPGR